MLGLRKLYENLLRGIISTCSNLPEIALVYPHRNFYLAVLIVLDCITLRLSLYKLCLVPDCCCVMKLKTSVSPCMREFTPLLSAYSTARIGLK